MMSKASQMYTVLKKAPIGNATDRKLKAWVNNDDPDAIWKYYLNCINTKSNVGESVESSNKISFEQLRNEVEQIYKGN